jgi:hypothetical protein
VQLQLSAVKTAAYIDIVEALRIIIAREIKE